VNLGFIAEKQHGCFCCQSLFTTLIIGGVINNIDLQLYILIIVSEGLCNQERWSLLLLIWNFLFWCQTLPSYSVSRQLCSFHQWFMKELTVGVLKQSELQSNNLICWHSRFTASWFSW